MKHRLLVWSPVVLVVLVIIGLVVPIVSTLQPDYYRRYPELGLRMDHWEVSTHSRISCGECHIEPGISGFAAFAAQSVPAFYSQLLYGPDDLNLLQAPTKDACQKCHTSFRSVAPSGDLRIPHRAHVEVLDMECVVCHEDMVHSVNRRGFNRPEMESCVDVCHDGDAASNACADCHTRKNTPESHERADWLQVHGDAAAYEDCASCHDWTPGYCAECHEKRPASHVGNWKTGHAGPAGERGDGCIVCHGGEEFCKQCH
ncbi:MAG: hypothetical protein EG823_08450 [Actinobacteria bacterium]|nr:hypothetical protein [Actinomycetota bacterium]